MPVWTPSPWFLVTPPALPVTVVERSRAVAALTRAASSHRVIEVTAPPGFGKSTAVGQWASCHEMPVAWLTLTRFDDEPAQIARGVFTALQTLAGRVADDRWLADLGVDPGDAASVYAALAAAFSGIDDPVALVIDDVHLAGKALEPSVVGALVDHPIPQLHLVLVGTEQADLPLSGPRLHGAVDRIGARQLAFTRAEVVAAAAAAGAELTDRDVEAIMDATAGWPVAVRLALIAHAQAGESDDGAWSTSSGVETAGSATRIAESSLLTDYVADRVLGGLPPELVDFVFAATTCSRVNAALATELSGLPNSSLMLDECVRRGLFLDRFDDLGHEPMYRWHQVFADSCRALLRRRQPERATALNRAAAHGLAERFPLEAIVHARRADDPALATEIITSGWIGPVVRAHGAALGRLCAQLDPPWSTDPAILAVRASCLDAVGDRAGAALLFARAKAQLEGEPSGVPVASGRHDAEDPVAVQRFTVAAARLFLANDPVALMEAVDEVTRLLARTRALGPRTYACGLFLAGWAEMRLRRDTASAIELLRAAERECEAVGEHEVAERARSNLGLALAYGGRFREADELHAGAAFRRATARGRTDQRRLPYDGGIEPMAVGFLAYWRDDLDAATVAFRRAIDVDGGDATYAALARVYLAFVASLGREPQAMIEAERGLQGVSSVTQHGVPWPVYEAIARMKLAEARGRMEEALGLAHRVEAAVNVPVCAVMAAEVTRRGGDVERSEALLDAIEPSATAPYLSASILVTRALLAHERGDADAHRLLEASLDVAVPESVVRPFSDDEPMLRALLVAHASWGTRHEGFIVERLAPRAMERPDRRGYNDELTRREQEVLGLMRTTMTAAEMAAALYVSINTLKTHQRSIYRKLGVTNRREAIRAAR